MQQSALSLMQDRAGFLWIGSYDGLHRYDGRTMKVFTAEPFDTTSLSGHVAYGLDHAADGGVWVATATNGLNRLDPATGRARHYRHDPGDPASLASDNLTDVLEAKNGDVWAATANTGLSRMRAPGRFAHYRHDSARSVSLSSDAVHALGEDPEGFVWAGTSNGASRIDPETGRAERFLYHDGSAETATAKTAAQAPLRVGRPHFAPGAAGRRIAWLPTSRGLVRLDYETGAHERFRLVPGEAGRPALNSFNAVVADPQQPSVLWATGTAVGLVRFDTRTETFTRYPHDASDPYSLSSNSGFSLLADRSGMMWVGTREGGLNTFNPDAVDFVHLRHDPGDPQSLAPGDVYGMYVDDAGSLWVSTRDGEECHLTQFDARTGRTRRYRHAPGDPNTLQPGLPVHFAEDAAGHVWAGHALWGGVGGGLSRIDPETGRVRRFQSGDGVPADVENLAPTRADPGILWVGRPYGVERFDTRTGTFERVPLNIPARTIAQEPMEITSMLDDASGTLWFGVLGNGLVRADGDTARVAAEHDPTDRSTISSNRITDLHERAREPGVLWLATGSGLNRYDTRTGGATAYFTEDGLPDDHVYDLREDGRGRLWMSTNGGLSSFDPATETFRNYGLDDGLVALEYNGNADAGRPGGPLYFGSGEGVTAFMPEDLRTNEIPPSVALTRLAMFNESVEVGAPGSPLDAPLRKTDRLTLAHDENQLTFQFAALHFENPEKNTFAYRLRGYDAGWVQAGTRDEATYTNLPPGDYRFEVKAANADGVWSEEAASVGVRILLPWWRTWGAYLGYALIGAAALYAWRLRNERQRRRLEATVAERTHEVEAQKEKLTEQAGRLQELDEAKSRFFANISHEFRTPLTLLLGPLRDALSDGEVLRGKPVRVMHRNAERLQHLINQLLDLSALDVGGQQLQLAPGDLVTFVRHTAGAFASLAQRKDLTFTVHTEPDALPWRFDSEKMEKVLANLISNAIKFTPKGGAVRVRLHTEEHADGEHEAVLAVRDTGPGLPEEEQERLFDRFYQADATSTRVQAGSGIGLALARELTTLHGGTIAVESTEGAGATFTVRLPARPAETEGEAATDRGAAEAAGADDQPEAAGTETAEMPGDDPDRPVVLVVDDHADLRAYVRGVLEGRFAVHTAADGRRGLKRARELLPDCIVTDVMMPGVDGFEMGRALQADALTEGIPLLFLTARASEPDEVKGFSLGADAYLRKPFATDVLTARIETLIAKRHRLRERIRQEEAAERPPLPEEPETPLDSPFTQKVRAAIQEHLADPGFTVQELADAVFLSRSQLYRRLKDEADASPSAFIRNERLRRARAMLRDREGTVTEVAYAVGFKSLSHFCNAFQERYDASPSDVLGG